MSKTYKFSVNKAIAAANRFGPGRIDAAEAEQIHRLISGRRSRAKSPGEPMDAPEGGPGVKAAMPAGQFIRRLEALGYNVSTAHRLLGMGRSTIYRMSKGKAEVPSVVARLMDMYERFGVPDNHRG